MLPLSSHRHFSADVRLSLKTGGKSFELAGAGPDEVFPRDGFELAPCDAELVMHVDSQTFTWPVRIDHAVVPFDQVVKVRRIGEIRRSNPNESAGNENGLCNAQAR